MAQVTTFVPAENGATTISTQINDTVYVLNSRTNTYKHVAHRVARFYDGIAITYCDVWARGGTVMPLESDAMVWCERGCKPATKNGG